MTFAQTIDAILTAPMGMSKPSLWGPLAIIGLVVVVGVGIGALTCKALDKALA